MISKKFFSVMRTSCSALSIIFYVSEVTLLASAANADTLVAGPSMTSPRALHTATALNDGTVLITGGCINCRIGNIENPTTGMKTAEIYSPQQNTFSAVSNMSTPRVSSQAILLPNGKVLIVGGDSGGQTVEIYNPAIKAFEAPLKMLYPHIGVSAVLLPSGNVLITGGSASYGEIFNPTTQHFTKTVGIVTVQLYYATAHLLSNGNVLIMGGETMQTACTLQGACTQILIAVSSAELYNSTTGRFINVSNNLTIPTVLPVAMNLSNGSVLVFNGISNIYNPSTNKFSAGPTLASTNGITSGNFPTGVLLNSGQIFVTGLFDESTGWFGGYFVYNPLSNVPANVVDMSKVIHNDYRYIPTIVHLPTTNPCLESILLTGGIEGQSIGGTPTATTDLYNIPVSCQTGGVGGAY